MRLVWPPVLLLTACLVGCGDPTAAENPEDTEPPKEQEEEPEPEPEFYLGGWLKAACADDIEGTGNKEGDIAEDFFQLEQTASSSGSTIFEG